eukprot:COSAG01_NODE_232_length_21016_cov_51.558876_3_plen_63_part_00
MKGGSAETALPKTIGQVGGGACCQLASAAVLLTQLGVSRRREEHETLATPQLHVGVVHGVVV